MSEARRQGAPLPHGFWDCMFHRSEARLASGKGSPRATVAGSDGASRHWPFQAAGDADRTTLLAQGRHITGCYRAFSDFAQMSSLDSPAPVSPNASGACPLPVPGQTRVLSNAYESELLLLDQVACPLAGRLFPPGQRPPGKPQLVNPFFAMDTALRSWSLPPLRW